MSYIQNFKKFVKAEDKKAEESAEVEAGANPQAVEEQGATPPQTPAPVASTDPAVQAAQKKLSDIDSKIGSLNVQIGELQKQRATAVGELNNASNAASQKAATAANNATQTV
jgi:hypothetical protein